MADPEIAIALCQQEREAAGRWFIAKDMNCDGLFTISDVGLWAKWAFYSPGDGLLWAVMQSQQLATFLELTPAVYSGWVSGIISAIIWLIVLSVWVVVDIARGS